MSDPNFEVGIHPNFLPESTQGSSHEAVLDYCIDIVPDARSMRMHSLFQSSPLLSLVSIKYPQVETDVSLFLPFHDNLQPVMKYEQDRSMTRLPYYWEDDNAAVDPTWRWDSPPPPSNGLKIFDFHPVLVALNIDDLKPYQQLKLKLGRRPLHDAAPEDVIGVANRGTGVADFLKADSPKRLDCEAGFATATRWWTCWSTPEGCPMTRCQCWKPGTTMAVENSGWRNASTLGKGCRVG